jgi:hypothetical protein
MCIRAPGEDVSGHPELEGDIDLPFFRLDDIHIQDVCEILQALLSVLFIGSVMKRGRLPSTELVTIVRARKVPMKVSEAVKEGPREMAKEVARNV